MDLQKEFPSDRPFNDVVVISDQDGVELTHINQ